MPLTGSQSARGDDETSGATERVRRVVAGGASGGVFDAGGMRIIWPSLSSTTMRAQPVMFSSCKPLSLGAVAAGPARRRGETMSAERSVEC